MPVGIHALVGNKLSETFRMSLEHIIEAIMDAGVNPNDLAGQKMTVIHAAAEMCRSGHSIYEYHTQIIDYFGYFLKVNANITLMDAACSASGYAINKGYRDIRTGVSESVIIIGSNSDERTVTTIGYSEYIFLNERFEVKVIIPVVDL